MLSHERFAIRSAIAGGIMLALGLVLSFLGLPSAIHRTGVATLLMPVGVVLMILGGILLLAGVVLAVASIGGADAADLSSSF